MLTKRRRTTGIGALALVSGCALFGFWRYHVADMNADIQVRRTKLVALRTDAASAGVSAGRLHGLRAAANALEERVATLEGIVAEREDIPEILRGVEVLAAKSNLTISRFTPQPLKSRPLYVELPYKLQLAGAYQDLAGFFEEIGRYQPIILVRDIAITAKQEQQEPAPLRIECVLTVPMLPEQSAPARSDVASARTPPSAARSNIPIVRETRDPFATPAPPESVTEPNPGRPAGLHGLRVGEMTVKGIIKDHTGFRAMLQGPGRRTFTVRSGDRLLDGAVKGVSADAITFSQNPDDLASADQSREVVKKLRSAHKGSE